MTFRIYGKLTCWLWGHRRRVNVPLVDVIGGSPAYRYLRCPRCLDLVARKARKGIKEPRDDEN